MALLDEEQKRFAEELLFSGKQKPSFAKQFYFGVCDASQVFPYPHVSKEEERRVADLLTKLQQFAEKNIDPDWIDRHSLIPDKVIQGLGAMGILGITAPKEYGGLGMTQYAYCRVVELLARRCGSTALFVNAHQSIGVKSILLFGNPQQKATWLPSLVKGEHIAAFSLTEPNAGSDASGIETRAVFDPEHHVYRLTGKKQWTTSGSIAKVLIVMAKTEVSTNKGLEDKVSAFIVTPGMNGFHVTDSALEKVGMRGTRTANLEFHNMEVPKANLLGPLGSGLKVCLTALDYGRTTFGAMCTGVAKMLLEKAISHSKSRYQFKRPLSIFPMMQQKITTIAAFTYAMDAATYLTAGLMDAEVNDVMLEAAMLKIFASEALWNIIYETMQIYGGRSFFSSEPLERIMRDARLNMIGEGANEVLRVFVGAVGLRDVGMELKEVVDALSNLWTAPDACWKWGSQWWRRRKSAYAIPVHSPLLKEETIALGKLIRKFGFSAIRVLGKYREEVVEKQLDLNRLASAAIAIYTVTAVVSKLESDLEHAKGNAEALGTDVAVGKFYCQQAITMAYRSLNSLFSPVDEHISNLSNKLVNSFKIQ